MIKKYQKEFLNYLEGTLSEEKKTEFETLLKANEKLRTQFDAYKRIVEMERRQNQKSYVLDEQFVNTVMAELKQKPSFLSEIIQMIFLPNKALRLGVATCAVMLVAITLLYSPEISYHRAVIQEPHATKELHKKRESTTSIQGELQQEQNVPLMDERPLNESKVETLRGKPAHNDEAGYRAPAQLPSTIQTLRESVASAPAANESDLSFSLPGRQREAGRIMPIPEQVKTNNFDNEQYQQLSANKPVMTSTESMSTFSLDVDTGSYTNARRFLERGTLPPINSIRVEEFINYFPYQYTTTNDAPIMPTFEIAPSLADSGKYLLKIGLKARDSKNSTMQKPWNLVFLIDVSGSMMPVERLPLIQRALETLVSGMRDRDRVSIVTYSGASHVALEPTGINEREKILRAIQSLAAGGSTHGSQGIQDAYLLAKRSFIEGGVNRVILATDGDFNVGITSTDELIRLIELKRKEGITLTTIGVGSANYNEALLEQIANKGNGNYFYLDRFSEARKVFGEELFGTIEVVAKDVKVQIEFNPQHVVQYRLLGYENRALKNEEFANDRIDAGDVGSGHTVTALYELVLANTKAANALKPEYRYKNDHESVAETVVREQSDEIAFFKMRYKLPESDSSELKTYPLERSLISDSLTAASHDFRFASAVAMFAEKLRQSQYASELTYKEIARVAAQSKGDDSQGYRQEFVRLVENASQISNE